MEAEVSSRPRVEIEDIVRLLAWAEETGDL